MTGVPRFYGLRVQCSQGHPQVSIKTNASPWVLYTSGIRRSTGEVVLSSGSQVLVDEAEVDPRLVFGTARRAADPEFVRRHYASGRSRHVMKCRRCGTSVQLRHETAAQVMQALVDDPATPWREDPHPDWEELAAFEVVVELRELVRWLEMRRRATS